MEEKMVVKGKLKNTLVSMCKYAIHKNNDLIVSRVLEISNFDRIIQPKVAQLQNIVFVTPYMSQHSGGLTSVLRIAQRLSERDLNVYFTCPTSDDCTGMINNAKVNLSTYTANYITWKEANNKVFDFVIPVQDTIVYYARSLKGYLVYFVQDYEPYFNPIGDRYFLAQKAYELGEDIISLGNWNLQEINRNLNSNKIGKMYSVEFPFEASEYPLIQKNFKKLKERKKINIAVYIKREGKRLPGIVMNMLERAYESFKAQGMILNIYYFGLHKIEKPAIGTNLGKIKKSEIRDLYNRCDFGMVASMTNISLVPYEMIASGLPVIEFSDGSYTSFLGDDTAILLESFEYRKLVNAIMYYKNNTNELELLCEKARKRIQNLSWDKTGEEFYNILKTMANQ